MTSGADGALTRGLIVASAEKAQVQATSLKARGYAVAFAVTPVTGDLRQTQAAIARAPAGDRSWSGAPVRLAKPLAIALLILLALLIWWLVQQSMGGSEPDQSEPVAPATPNGRPRHTRRSERTDPHP